MAYLVIRPLMHLSPPDLSAVDQKYGHLQEQKKVSNTPLDIRVAWPSHFHELTGSIDQLIG